MVRMVTVGQTVVKNNKMVTRSRHSLFKINITYFQPFFEILVLATKTLVLRTNLIKLEYFYVIVVTIIGI